MERPSAMKYDGLDLAYVTKRRVPRAETPDQSKLFQYLANRFAQTGAKRR